MFFLTKTSIIPTSSGPRSDHFRQSAALHLEDVVVVIGYYMYVYVNIIYIYGLARN